MLLNFSALSSLIPGLGGSRTSMLLLLGMIVVFVYLIYKALAPADPMARRVQMLNEKREQLKAGITESRSKKRAHLIHQSDMTEKMRELLQKLRVLQEEQVKPIQQKLAQAGIRSKETAILVIFLQLVLPVAIGGFLFFGIYVFGFLLSDWGAMSKFMIFAGALILSYKGPDIYLKNATQKRMDAIRKGLPDALDLLVICAEAGLTIDVAYNRVSRELGAAYPELGDEFTLTAIELSFLNERRQAFENLSWRVKLDAIRSVVTTLIQTEKYGTPLASALRVLSAEFRNERMLKAEEKAARLPAIMTVPLILFILPFLFVVILGPAACSIKDSLLTG